MNNIENVEIVIAGKGPDSEKVENEAKKYKNVKVLGRYNYEQRYFQTLFDGRRCIFLCIM